MAITYGDREPTPAELLDGSRVPVEAIFNLGVVAHWLTTDPAAMSQFATWLSGGPGGKIPPIVYVQEWLAVSHDALMPDCPEPFPRPGRDAALAQPWSVHPGGRG